MNLSITPNLTTPSYRTNAVKQNASKQQSFGMLIDPCVLHSISTAAEEHCISKSMLTKTVALVEKLKSMHETDSYTLSVLKIRGSHDTFDISGRAKESEHTRIDIFGQPQNVTKNIYPIFNSSIPRTLKKFLKPGYLDNMMEKEAIKQDLEASQINAIKARAKALIKE